MENFKFIEDAFAKIKKKNSSGVKELSDGLSNHFNRKIQTTIVNTKSGDNIFVMSVTPLNSTIDKVLQYMTGTESKLKAISDIWHSCKDWRLDIDRQILSFLTADELAALTLHEMHHIIETDRIPNKLVNVVQFSVATSKISQKAALHNTNVQKILKLPIMSTCQTFFDKNRMVNEIRAERKSLQKEHRADMYAKNNGYMNSLISAMSKLSKRIKQNMGDQNIQDAITYSMNIIDTLESRKNLLVKNRLNDLSRALPDSLIKECVNEIEDEWILKSTGEVDSYITESVHSYVEDAYFTEFSLFGKLQPIEQNQLDYIAVRIESMETVNDKMMILSYINSKLELVDYYISILSDKKLAKRYKVPHSMDKLIQIRGYLNKLRERALNTSVAKNDKNIVVYYPTGYEG